MVNGRPYDVTPTLFQGGLRHQWQLFVIRTLIEWKYGDTHDPFVVRLLGRVQTNDLTDSDKQLLKDIEVEMDHSYGIGLDE
jgi:hypothetical protein